MKRIIFSISLVMLCTLTLFSQGYVSNNLRKTKWELVWSDEFEYTGLPDSTKWNFDTHGNSWGWGNNEAQWYTENNAKNAHVSNGVLRITAIKEPTNGKDYSSARLTTKDKGDWKYCRIDVSAKLPSGLGTWPAIWMMPTKRTYGGWPECGEIDIMEHVGFAVDSVFSTVHTGTFNHIKGTQVGKALVTPNATDGFNIYTLEWDEYELRSYINGQLFFVFQNARKTFKEWPFDQEFHLILNLAVGGGLGGARGMCGDCFPQHFDIDYVRVYNKKSK